MIRVNAACKSFGDDPTMQTAALSNVNLLVGDGETMAILGPNGAGKTTLLKAIAGETELDSGTIQLGGARLSAPVAFVTQDINASILPDLNLAEHLFVASGRRGLLGKRAWREIGREANVLCPSLAGRLGEYPEHFSGGEKQITAAAMALLSKPCAILLDEPTASLDADNTAKFWDVLSRYREGRSDLSMLIVTHDCHQAASQAERALILVAGAVRAEMGGDGQPLNPDELRELAQALD